MSIYNDEMKFLHKKIYLPAKNYISKYKDLDKEKAQLSLQAFIEFYRRLLNRILELNETEDELYKFIERQEGHISTRPLDEIQIDFVDKTEAFHQHIYSTLSSFVKLLSILAPHDFIKGSHIASNEKFISYIRELTNYDTTILQASLKYRGTYIDHTSQIRHFNWMTYFFGSLVYIIYYEPDINGKFEEICLPITVEDEFKISLPVKVNNFFITPHHKNVVSVLNGFIEALFEYLKIN